MTWSHAVVTVHILAAITWVGGMVFLALVAVPATRGLEPPLRATVLRAVGRRFRVVGWAALGVLIITGWLNAGRYGYGPAELLTGGWLASGFGRILATKLALVLVMIGLTLAHDLVGQRANRSAGHALPQAGSPAAGSSGRREGAGGTLVPGPSKKLVALSTGLALANLTVAVAVVILASLLLRVAW